MRQVLADLKHASRVFHESPGFTATVVGALMLGIGLNTAIFSVFSAVLLKPLPFPDPDTLVVIENTAHGKAQGPWLSPVEFAYWRAQTDVLSDVAVASHIPRQLNYTGGDTPERVLSSQVSESYFRVLRAPIVRGRPFSVEEDQPGGRKVAVISYDFWQRRLGGVDDALGMRLPLSGDFYTIVGIMGPTFDLASLGGAFGNPDVWVPFQLDPNAVGQVNYLDNLARLKPGVTLAEAQARVVALSIAFRERFPRIPKEDGFTVLSAKEALTARSGDPRIRLWVLLGAVGCVLLIACTNVASLLLVRATGRAREIAIRSALGAGRWRIARQLLTESLLLSLAGGALGLVAGFLGVRALLAVNTGGLPRIGAEGSLVGLDWRVVTFTFGLSLATGLLFGLAPALVGSRTDPNAVIKGAGGLRGRGARRSASRSVLVAVEVGLAVVLLIGAALLIRTSLALGRTDPGFDSSHVLTMRTAFTSKQFPTAGTLAATLQTGLERVRSMPGVERAAVTCCLPVQGDVTISFDVVGRPHEKRPFTGAAGYVPSSEDYFAALGVAIIRGRAFTARDDRADAPPVALINQAMAKVFWTNGLDPLQDSIVIGAGIKQLRGGPARRVVGIVGDVRYRGLAEAPAPTMYVPLAQVADPLYALFENFNLPVAWVVRTRGESAPLATGVQRSIREGTGLPVEGVEAMDRVVSASVSRQRLNMLLMSIFGGGALLLAAIGIYGLLANSVQLGVREIGVRMALGASAERVERTFVAGGLLPVVVGIAGGLVVAFCAADLLASLLFGVEPRDPEVFGAVPVVLALIALVSLWLPARRASRVNPSEALRHD